MRPPEDVKRELVQGWSDKAEGDLRAARHLLTGGDEHVASVAFHAQQAAEKYLKAFLVHHQIEFPKTHDIARLLELVEATDSLLANLLADATVLTPYGVEYRYPGDHPEVTLSEAERCVRIANSVREAVLNRLPGRDALPRGGS